VDEKFWRGNGKENFFRVCLVGWGRRKINGGARVFSLELTKKFSLQNEEKLKRENETA